MNKLVVNIVKVCLSKFLSKVGISILNERMAYGNERNLKKVSSWQMIF